MMPQSADGSDANKNLLGLQEGRSWNQTGDQDAIGGSAVGVSSVRAQEAKDAVVKLSVLVIDFGDGAVLANNMSNKGP